MRLQEQVRAREQRRGRDHAQILVTPRQDYATGCWQREERMKSAFDAARLFLRLSAALIATGLAACETVGGASVAPDVQDVAATAVVPEQIELSYIPASEPFRVGLQQFNRGNYGLAERYFRDVVEKDHNNAMAWIGLAGSYDHIGRFDLADRAYRTAISLLGETPQILNNMGYSYILRGQYRIARKYIMKAFARQPGDPVIIANVALINSLDPPAQP
jgi:Flp pilus assembly protein TadD